MFFSPGLGTYRGDPVHFSVDQSIAPRFFKARPVPWAYRSRVDEEIDRLEKAGIIRPIDSSDWADQWYQCLREMVQFGCAATIR